MPQDRRAELKFRFALPADAPLLAAMNQQLIRDEGHRNPMDLAQLAERMRGWLAGEYRAVLFESLAGAAGYALWREEPEYVYLRQLFVVVEHRRQGIGRAALAWLWRNAWRDAARLRVEVLVGNTAARAFWCEAGFEEYCVTLEMTGGVAHVE